jgi:hypothetical protein
MKSDQYKIDEEAILKAVEAYETDKTRKITSVAREFGVSYPPLRRRIQGGNSRITRAQSNKILSNDQEKALIDWITRLDQIGASPNIDMVRNAANSMLQRNHPNENPPLTVGPNWPYRFIARLPPQFQRVKQKPMDHKRINSEDINAIKIWFSRLGVLIKEYDIQPSNLFNFDETGFRIGHGKQEKVITAYPNRASRIGSASNRESITIIECIAASGSIIPPMIIFAGKAYMEEWFQQGVDNNYLFAISDKGFISDSLALEWLHHFDQHTKQHARKQYRLLLLDNANSHLTYEFVSYAEEKKIILYAFPPHTTHLLQPLDGIPFQQYKHFHGKVVTEQARLGNEMFDKKDFLHHLRQVRFDTFKSRTIRAGFADRGIWPLNIELILKKLEAPDNGSILVMKDGVDPLRSSPTIASTISPPRTVPRLRQKIIKAQKSLTEITDFLDSVSPSLSRRLDRIFEGSLYQAELGAQRQEDAERLLKLNRRKSNPKNHRQVKAGGPLTASDANRRIADRSLEDMKKIWRKAEREAKKRKKEEASQAIHSLTGVADNEEGDNAISQLADSAIFCIDRDGFTA